MILQHGYVAKDAADADLAAEELNAFYCYFGAWFVNKRPITQGLIEPITPEEMDAHPFYSAKAMRENLLIGDAAEVIEKLKKMGAKAKKALPEPILKRAHTDFDEEEEEPKLEL
jgi:alkanesulfonate monooxygenase SsuD/methylene tetrahydromethanopterin reductase-like flavin-dependent oxidoreductase (luciferase family)